MPIAFAKAHACGNDFLLVDDEAASDFDRAELARRLCARNTGVGADGVEFMTRAGRRDARIRLYNADGSLAEISGNGTRCVAAFLACEGGLSAGDELLLETDAGPRLCRIEQRDGRRLQIRTGMGAPKIAQRTVKLEDGAEVRGAAISMGNPHFVIFVEDAEFSCGGRPWRQIGGEVSVHPAFPAQTNVEFVRMAAPGRIEIRIYERGVGPTASSGTGTSAAAAAAIALRGAAPELEVAAPGGSQRVEWAGCERELLLTGPAELIASGVAYLADEVAR